MVETEVIAWLVGAVLVAPPIDLALGVITGAGIT